MSITYPTLTETNFPDAIDNISRMSDLSYSDIPLVSQYYAYYNAGNLNAAAALLDANPSLKTKIFNAVNANKQTDGLIAVQTYFKNDLQNYLNEQLTYREPYNPSTEYKKTNIIDFNGEGFICRVAGAKGVAPVNGSTTTTWALIAKQGIQGVTGTGLAPRGLWLSTETYYANDCVADNNALWQCLTGNTNSKPSDTNTNWTKLIDINISGKADKFVPTTVGNFAGLDVTGNLLDSGSKASDFAVAVHNHDIAVVGKMEEFGDTEMEVGTVANAGAGWNSYRFREAFDAPPKVVLQAEDFAGVVLIKSITAESFMYCLRELATGSYFTAGGIEASSVHSAQTLVNGTTTTATAVKINYLAVEYGGER